MDKTTQAKLEQLNFSEILKYERPINRRYRGESGTPLKGFCHDCEDHDFAPRNGSCRILMSHGCSSADFEALIGRPLPEAKCSLPVMFLLQNPGGDYENGQSITIDDVTKNPPVNHFYFAPSLTDWPTYPCGNHYGDYFAYLMSRFGLSNVYITNCVKCKYPDTSDPTLENPDKCYTDTADNCIARFLEKEIAIFRPSIIFCFGKKASDELLWKRIQSPGKLPDVQFKKVVLLHPATRRRWDNVVQGNDQRISKALDEFKKTESSAI